MSLIAHLDDHASLNSFALVEGAGLSRRQIFARLDGEHAKVALNGATLARGRQHADTTLVVDHAVPHGESRERFRNILDEQATGVFQGKIVVRPHAQKTDGVMQSKAILLSDHAVMNNKPELEIFADDVTCGHGATCGRLDKDQLFYLMARGLQHHEAEALLIEGFANEAFEGLNDESLRDFLVARISAWLTARS
jgi:Fe-S cluster assembly protein SufD